MTRRYISPLVVVRHPAFICSVINFVVIIFIVLAQQNLPPEVPLFYGMPQDESILSSRLMLTIPPVICLVMIGINTILTILFEDDFIKKVLFSMMFLVTTLSTITVFKIIFLVGSI